MPTPEWAKDAPDPKTQLNEWLGWLYAQVDARAPRVDVEARMKLLGHEIGLALEARVKPIEGAVEEVRNAVVEARAMAPPAVAPPAVQVVPLDTAPAPEIAAPPAETAAPPAVVPLDTPAPAVDLRLLEKAGLIRVPLDTAPARTVIRFA